MAHEEIGLHRDDFPQVIVSLKGGTITRLEADGSTTDVKFPKGEPVYPKPTHLASSIEVTTTHVSQ